MSGYEKITNRILEDAKLQAKEHIELAEKEAIRVEKSAEEEALKTKSKILEKAKSEAVEVRKRMLAMHQLEERKQQLTEKQEVVSKAFDKALDKLCAMPDEEYRGVLMDMILKLSRDGKEEIILSQKDKTRLGEGFVDELNIKMKQNGLGGNIRLCDTVADIRGGLILKLGDVQMNSSFETLIRIKREYLEAEVYRLLF